MMVAIEQAAQQWIDDELIAREHRPSDRPRDDAVKLQMSPARWVLPKLLRIVYHNTDQPVEALAPLIRDMLQEQVFVTTGGDPVDCERLEDSINETVALLVTVLERVRRQCMIQPRV
jgi:hypothetical protein